MWWPSAVLLVWVVCACAPFAYAQIDLRFRTASFHKFCSGASVIRYPPDASGVFPPPSAALLCPSTKPINSVCDNLGFTSVRQGQCVYSLRDQLEDKQFSLDGLVVQRDDGSDIPDIISGVEIKSRLRIFTYFTEITYRGYLKAPFAEYTATSSKFQNSDLPSDLTAPIFFSSWSSTSVTVSAIVTGVENRNVTGVYVRLMGRSPVQCTSECSLDCCDPCCPQAEDFSNTLFPVCLKHVVFDLKSQVTIFPSCPTISEGQTVTISGIWNTNTPTTQYSRPFNASWLNLILSSRPTQTSVPKDHKGHLYVSVFYGTSSDSELRAVVAGVPILNATVIKKDDPGRNFAADIIGRFSSVNNFLRYSVFVPLPFLNNIRVISPCLDGKRCSGAPSTQETELIDLKVVMGDDTPFPDYDAFNDTIVNLMNARTPFSPPLNTLRIMVRFIPTNNPPVFENPSASFNPAPGSLELDFGRYYVFEGGGRLLTLSGIAISDIDLFENCFSLAECQLRAVDASIGSQRGSVALNSLVGISVYSSPGSLSIGFTASLSSLNTAIRALVYDIGARASSDPQIAVFNTQRLENEVSEAVSIVVSDQGFYGLSQVATTGRLDVPITVVAKNTAPKARESQSGAFVNCIEDQVKDFSGPIVEDVDLADKTLSSYAEREWLNSASFIGLKNKMSLTISSEHGKLFLPFIRDVDIISTDNYYAITIGNLHPDSDSMAVFEQFPSLIEKVAGSWCLRALSSAPCVTFGGGSSSLSFFISLQTVKKAFPAAATPTDKIPLIVDSMLQTLRNLHNRSHEDLPDHEYRFQFVQDSNEVKYIQPGSPLEDDDESIKVGYLNLRSTCGGWPSRLGGQVCNHDSDCRGNLSHPFGFERYYPNSQDPVFVPCFFSASNSPSEYEKCRCCSSRGGIPKGSVCSIFSQCGQDATTGNDMSSCGCTFSRNPDGPNRYFSIPDFPPFPHSGFENGTKPTDPPLNLNTYRGQNFMKCLPIFSLTPGSSALTMLSDVQFVGSYNISLVGPMNLINQAVATVRFSPNKNFNTLFRPSPEPRNFDRNAPFLAPIHFTFNDNGNSGGYLLEPRSTKFTINMVVAPVNDPPSIVDNRPDPVCVESSSILVNFTVSDEDISEFQATTYVYNVNISVQNAVLSVDFAKFTKSSDILLRSSKNLVFQGVLSFINTIVSRITYSPRDLYHTDGIDRERIIIVVTDNKGNLDVKPERSIAFQTLVSISSVNNPPAIGRCSATIGEISLRTPGCPSTQNRFIHGLRATNTTATIVEDLWNENLLKSDPFFWVNSTFLLISDPDSSEARTVIPKLLKNDQSIVSNFTSNYYGAIFVELEVLNGTISVIPKPPIQLKHVIIFFYPNCTYSLRKSSCVICGRPVNSFDDIIGECAVGRRVVFETQHEVLVQGATMRSVQLIRYNPDKYFNGIDVMRIAVSDQGFYSRTGIIHNVSDFLTIRVLSYNNVPQFVQPYDGPDSSVMNYQKGLVCNEDNCENFMSSRFPTGHHPSFSVVDQDVFEDVNSSHSQFRYLMAATSRGLIRITFLIEENKMGSGRIICRNCSAVSTQRSVISGSIRYNSFQIEGHYSDVNSALKLLYYDAHPSFMGYEEINVLIDDFGSSGEIQPRSANKLGKASVDVVVGGLKACDVYKTCLACKSNIRCGWCPSICGGAGFCLDGSTEPKYTTCPPHPVDGRIYNQCTVQFPDAIQVLVLLAGAVVGGSFIAYHFFMLVNRKHGDLSSFLRKKKVDATALGARLYLLPPEAAVWSQFLAAIVFVAAFFLLVQNFAGLAVFRVEPDPFTDIFIASASSISISADNCRIRIINAEGYFGTRDISDTDDPLSGLLLRFDFLKDENVIFQQVGCVSDHKQFVVVNNRMNSSRYIGYHCNIELVVPPHFVLPTLIFTATGSNVSYIRAGPLDDDVKNFTDFSFGPNSLRMYGNHLQAKFKGIRKVKHVVFEAQNGLLSMDDVNFVSAKLNSTFADVIISTPSGCDAKYLQKSRNDVCLSFFQSSISPECYPNIFFPSLVLNPPNPCPVGINCENLKQLCNASSDCFGNSGECDDEGLCTTIQCSGLFLGNLVSQRGDVFKQPSTIEMFSTFGILSLSSVHPSLPLGDVTVNKKVDDEGIDINPGDHAALDQLFHPGGGLRPKQDWWNLFVSGAGVLDASEGTFVWLSNARYLVLSPALLDVVSLGLLSPDRGKSQSNLQPGFCPPVPSSNDEKARRVIALYKLLRRKLELTPSLKETKLPDGSFITFINTTSGVKSIFGIDPLTNADIIGEANPTDYPFLLLLIYLGAYIIPATFSAVLVFSLARKYHLVVIEKRIKMYRQDMVAKQMLLTPDVAEADIEAELEDFRWDNSNVKMYEIYGKTGPFYLLDDYVDSAERQKSVLKLIAESVRHVLVIAAPTALVLLFASSYQNSQLVHMCEFRVDRARCLATPIPLVNIIFYAVAAYVAVAFLELMGYYLRLSFNTVRLFIRHLFHIGYLFMMAAACAYLIVLMLWCIVGVLISPSKLAPYATALICFIAHAVSLFGSLRITQSSVEKIVRRRVAQHSSRLQGMIHPAVLEIITNKNADQALHDAGYSVPKVVVSLFFSCFLLLLIDVCLFYGFRSFSDPNDGIASIVNCCLVLGASIAINRSETGTSGNQTSASIEKAAKRISDQVKDVLDMVAGQIKAGLKLIETMHRLQADGVDFDDLS